MTDRMPDTYIEPDPERAGQDAYIDDMEKYPATNRLPDGDFALSVGANLDGPYTSIAAEFAEMAQANELALQHADKGVTTNEERDAESYTLVIYGPLDRLLAIAAELRGGEYRIIDPPYDPDFEMVPMAVPEWRAYLNGETNT